MRQVLLITNNRIFSTTITACLQQDHYTVTVAANGREADQMLRQSQFDLVISDVCVPLTNGLELLTNICHQQPKSPVIMVSPIQNEQAIAQYYKLGANLFLTHPVNPFKMLQDIRAMLSAESNAAA